jgi:hypothetical protein
VLSEAGNATFIVYTEIMHVVIKLIPVRDETQIE